MNAVGIDVSKGKSMVTIIRPFGEVVCIPFEVKHNEEELNNLSKIISKLNGETRIVMEATGGYHESIAKYLQNKGFFVSVINPILIHDFNHNTLRKVKTDKADALKIANYALTNWIELREYTPENELRKTLKIVCREYEHSCKISTMMKNNLYALLELTFPKIEQQFTSPAKESDGHEKWIDFVLKFWHKDTVAKLPFSAFAKKYETWCKNNNYYFNNAAAKDIHNFSRTTVASIEIDAHMKNLVKQICMQLIAVLETIAKLRKEMDEIASQLPEYDTVKEMFGTGKILTPQLIAEIGDTRRFKNRKAITAFAGFDPPPYQSGTVDVKSRSISKRGSARLRRILFLVIKCYIMSKPEDEPVYQFICKKKAEGKNFYVYMTAAANKFLRIYYARVNEVLLKKQFADCSNTISDSL